MRLLKPYMAINFILVDSSISFGNYCFNQASFGISTADFGGFQCLHTHVDIMENKVNSKHSLSFKK